MRRRGDGGRATTHTPSASAGTEAAFTAADAGGNDLPRDNHAELGTDKILFARPDLTIVWRQARDYIARYKLLRPRKYARINKKPAQGGLFVIR